MKILLIGNYEKVRQQSMLRFADLLRQGLRAAGCHVHLIRPQSTLGILRQANSGVGKWLGYADRFLLFPLSLRRFRAWADIVHICDQANAVYIPWLNSTPHVVTCHDMIAIRSAMGEFREHHTRWSGRILQKWILRSLRRAHHISCVSMQTQYDLLRISEVPSSRISLVPNALNYPYRPMAQGQALAVLGSLGLHAAIPFLLHVGSNDWYKNRVGALRIFWSLSQLAGFERHHFICAGKNLTAEMRAFVAASGLNGRVHELPDVTNEELRALYSRAVALLFPSLHEGFGWPIIEAQACGCLVITSNRPPMTEVAGDGAIYIDPRDETAAAVTISNELAERDRLVSRGFQNVKRFSLSTMVEEYLRIYRTLLEPSSSETLGQG